MSQTVTPMRDYAVSNTVTLTTTPQDILSYQFTEAKMMLTFLQSNVQLFSFNFSIAGDLAIVNNDMGNYIYTGVSNAMLPYAFQIDAGTLTLDYVNHRIQAYLDTGSAGFDIVAQISTCVDNYGANKISADTIVESVTGSGTTFGNKVIMNGGSVSIGTSASTTDAINIGTNSNTGGRTVTIGNTVSGSSTVINGPITFSNPETGTVTFNDNSNISWTSTSSSLKKIGGICYGSVTATLNGSLDVNANQSYSFFTVPSNFASSTTVVAGCIVANGSNKVQAMAVNEGSTTAYNIILNAAVVLGGTRTVSCSFSYTV